MAELDQNKASQVTDAVHTEAGHLLGPCMAEKPALNNSANHELSDIDWIYRKGRAPGNVSVLWCRAAMLSWARLVYYILLFEYAAYLTLQPS